MFTRLLTSTSTRAALPSLCLCARFSAPSAPRGALRRPSPAEKAAKGVFVANLDQSITEMHLKEFMNSAGEVAVVQFSSTYREKNKRTATVVYAEAASAERAMLLKGVDFMGRPLYVRRMTAVSEAETGRSTHLLYVANLPASVTVRGLKTAFGGFGPVGPVTMFPRDHDMGHWACVFMKDVSCIDAIMQEAKLAKESRYSSTAALFEELDIRRWRDAPAAAVEDEHAFRQASPPGASAHHGRLPTPSNQIVVINLPLSTEDHDFSELCQASSEAFVYSEVVHVGDNYNFKKVGMAEFLTVNDAEKVIEMLTGHMYGGRYLVARYTYDPHIFKNTPSQERPVQNLHTPSPIEASDEGFTVEKALNLAEAPVDKRDTATDLDVR